MASGYTINGVDYDGLWVVSSPETVEFTDQTTYAVRQVTDDAWNYGVGVGNGFIGVGIDSPLVSALKDNTAGRSGLIINSGPVVDQTFAGGSTVSTTPSVWIGGSSPAPGQYECVNDLLEQATVTANAEGRFPLASVGFGKATFTAGVPTQAFYKPLGYPNQAQSAIITPGFKGLGLPSYLWSQLVNLFYKVDATIATELQCEAAIGGVCRFQQPCSNYTQLWGDWGLHIQFENDSNYIILPLTEFAEDVNGVCTVWIQYFEEAQHS